jgi:hypothetical protein
MQHILDIFHYPVFWFKNTCFWNWLCFHHHHQVKTWQPALLGPLDWTDLYPQRRQGHKTSDYSFTTLLASYRVAQKSFRFEITIFLLLEGYIRHIVSSHSLFVSS